MVGGIEIYYGCFILVNEVRSDWKIRVTDSMEKIRKEKKKENE